MPRWPTTAARTASQGDTAQELQDLEAAWELTPARWRCAHCRDRITGEGHTWFGPLPEPGQDPGAVPRFHIDRDPCRAAGGWPPMAR
ncbi:hypothetical protein [Kitasatospora sp. GP82]|uniref:hypothetical protein n=1 Tax=Kitasatospora sp. GP82 TaxID=3035089 RepID=UPI002473533C|nr:hypothetical protein [Kitasatospora sp. GP82]MDH6129885.1 hypothetical protein [Kitasatospora sp. GP82]